jgi:1-deoxy-D-xylulose-5-phosphate reductoisomerase
MISRDGSTPLRIAVLGSTGSVGRQTLDVAAHAPERFRVVALAAKHASQLLNEQIAEFQPDLVAITEADQRALLNHQRVEVGEASLLAAATHPDADIIVVATAGHAAIVPTIEAIKAGKQIALANKETIVCAGEIIVPLARRHGVSIRPVDSEHSAIWQSLGGRPSSEIARLIVTASGGPFRTFTTEQLERVTADEALAHPTWSMGGKITIDSATLMNKGLEIIEARWLFDVGFDRIEALIHPESIIHSLVEFVDGGQVAQLGLPDMRLPIQYALTYPQHEPSPCRRLSLADIGALHFEPPDPTRFPALALARAAGKAGGTTPTVLSTADEVAVEAFIGGRIAFPDIARLVGATLDRHVNAPVDSIEAIQAADSWARRTATGLIPAFER